MAAEESENSSKSMSYLKKRRRHTEEISYNEMNLSSF